MPLYFDSAPKMIEMTLSYATILTLKSNTIYILIHKNWTFKIIKTKCLNTTVDKTLQQCPMITPDPITLPHKRQHMSFKSNKNSCWEMERCLAFRHWICDVFSRSFRSCSQEKQYNSQMSKLYSVAYIAWEVVADKSHGRWASLWSYQ